MCNYSISVDISLPYTVVEIIEAYELSFGQWGIFLFACAFVREVGMTIDNFVGRLNLKFIEHLARTYQTSIQSCTQNV